MNRPSPAQLDRARRLLAHEGAAGSDEPCAIAAARVYEKLHEHLAPLVGAAGVQALFARSAKLANAGFDWPAEVAVAESSTGLRAWLQGLEPVVANERAAALFGAFFSLITTFIGERLTSQALRSAWPMIGETASTEKTK